MIVVDGKALPLLARHAEKTVAGLQLRDVGRGGEAVPWTDLLAAVAAINGIAHLLFYIGIELTSVLNGLVGQAFS